MKAKLLILSFAFFGIAHAQYTKLLDFGGSSNGRTPYGSLISDGTFLYGMTRFGGTNDAGTVFKIKLDGSGYIKLIDFTGTSNGMNPHGALISDGTFLYGMTVLGGTYSLGTVFKIKPDGTGYTKLLDLEENSSGSLISDGTFMYGMTGYGGTNGMGTVFKIKPDGTGYIKLLEFAGISNGSLPFGSLISDGAFLYGMTKFGGTNNDGTVFKIKSDGTGYTKLLDFAGGSNGRSPYGSLISDGTFLYGMTLKGGTSDKGTIFKIKPDGTGYTKLLDFGGTSNGSLPFGSLISEGNFLYGMTYFGGTNDSGTVFRIKPDGTEYSKLLDFEGRSNGGGPWGSLISDGTFLYGMTSFGGTNDYGTVFKIKPDGIVGITGNNAATAFSVYPNPFSTSTTLQTDNLFHNATLTVNNSFGQTVAQIRNLSGQTVTFFRDNLSSGLYFIRLIEENKTIAVDKLVIVDK